MVDYGREDLICGRVRWTDLIPPEWQEENEKALDDLRSTGAYHPQEREYFRRDGSRVPVLLGAAAFGERRDHGVAFVVDLSERKRAEREMLEIQTTLVHSNRVETLGQLSASIAHEISQPLAAAVTNARAALRWMDAQPPDPGEVRAALERIVDNGDRAAEVISRIHALVKKAPPRQDRVEINEAIMDVVALTGGEASKYGVMVETNLGENLPPVQGDRVQLQQVILNLIVNAFEAMSHLRAGQRALRISTGESETHGAAVAVEDSGPGLQPEDLERVFEAFYTTKSSGLGVGLSICRSIIEAHGGRLWATPGEPCGIAFRFVLPACPQEQSAEGTTAGIHRDE
jgi:C4-dicarboxylate-specific signal transduction histidine kinase